jgi:hypothetical protein
MKIYIDHQILPRYTDFAFVDNMGKEAPAQAVEHHSDGTYWMVWVNDVPAFGFKKYRLQIKSEKPKNTYRKDTVLKMENPWYQIQVDTLRGAVASVLAP